MLKLARRLNRAAGWIAVAYVFQSFSCVPDNAIRQVAAENIVRTFNLITSTIVSLLFFPFGSLI